MTTLSDDQKKLLNDNRKELMETINLKHGLLDSLMAKRVITLQEKGDIENEMTYRAYASAGVGKLLDMLSQKSQKNYEDFCLALIEKNQGHVVNTYLKSGCKDTDEEKYFAKLSETIGFEWAMIATFLNIDLATQDRLKHDHKDDLRMAIQSMFTLWLRRERQTNSFERCGEILIDALRQGGRTDLSEGVTQQFKLFAERERGANRSPQVYVKKESKENSSTDVTDLSRKSTPIQNPERQQQSKGQEKTKTHENEKVPSQVHPWLWISVFVIVAAILLNILWYYVKTTFENLMN